MQDLQEQLGLTYLFITHNLSVGKHISNNIMVMYLGQMVEKASSDELFARPLHPYTKALLSAIPSVDLDHPRQHIQLKGEITSPTEACHQKTPELREVYPGHFVACDKVEV